MSDPDSPVKLAEFITEFEATVVANKLKDRGIESAVAMGGFTSGFKAEAPGYVSVLVARKEAEKARILLKEIQEEDDDVDWSQVDVGEPEDD